jgi:PhnB protein
MSKQPLIDQLDQAIGRMLANPDAVPSSVDPSVVELLRVAADLRDLPRPDFKITLKADLERKALETMMSTKTVTFRTGFRTITPYLLAPGPEFIDFLKRVFDAEETERTETGPGRFHAEFRIGDSMLMIGVGSGRKMPAGLIVYVKDADETYRRALETGATSRLEIIENYGDRFGVVQDPAGNTWCIATYLGGQSIGQEHLNTVTMLFSLKGAAKFIDFLKQAFSAQEIVRYDSPEGEVNHAKIRIGESVIAVGEAHDQWQSLPTMIYMYVPDCDALYEQALRAGAKSVSPVADQSYGDRHGGVEDEWGNQWYIATPIK